MKKRETELDILRIVATIGVIFTHASNVTANTTFGQSILTFWIAIITWHVPVFVMISGRFFLDPNREISPSKLKQAIIRLIIAFLFWNIIYQLYYIVNGTYQELNWKGILSQVLIGPYHFWYLFMLVALYAITPFLRKITEKKELAEYFLILFFVFSFLTTYGIRLPGIGPTLSQILSHTGFHFALGFSGYYVLGHYLHQYPLSGKKEFGLYILGAAMILFTGIATVWKAANGAPGEEWFSKYLMPNIIIEAAAIYTFFTNRICRLKLSAPVQAAVSQIAANCFGIYLVHALILDLLCSLVFNLLPISAISLVLLRVFCTFIVALIVVCFVRKIPYVGKKIT